MRTIAIALLLCLTAPAQSATPQAVVKEAWEAVAKTYVDMPAHKAEWQRIRATYFKPYKTPAQAHAAIRDMLATLHNSRLQWLSTADVKTTLAQFSGPMPKLGLAFLSFEFLPGEKKIITPLANSSAAAAGIRKGDVLQSVNGTDVSKMSPGELVRLLARVGEKPATLVVLRDGKPMTTVVEPGSTGGDFVSSGADRSAMRVSAYITLREFTVPAISEFKKAIASFQKQNTVSYQIDLRNNPGGLIDAVMEIGGLFVSDADFICMNNAAGKTRCRKTKPGKAVTGDVTILVNEGTASAAEVFAAGMQRTRRGQVIGCRSYGHGYGGQLTLLSDGSALLIPDSSYLDPDGQPLEGRGINPDVVKCTPF